MAYAVILLSGQERKAFFKAAQYLSNSWTGWSAEFADYLCDQLDDGGIWNPCKFVVEPIRGQSHAPHSLFGPSFILNAGIRQLQEYEHDLRMIRDRLKSVAERGAHSKPAHDIPPFLHSRDYYGPNWGSVREDAIERDNYRCVACGISRAEHRRRWDEDLHVHHMRSRRQFGDYREANELSNLETLCRNCHIERE